ncbi:hypothetical protein KKC08_03050 [Patescibacteria group bacterium]|nr:hypothetical protein [Patescibacteria group bacterium]MCG2702051.1 hypothetical protein [Candidatus Parcubacteria bacterium]MBU4265570.1 hypothetical protein [Patescibacteria group bacterium]MBU4389899.1 hypothetical protein [Patescibacteria group bacterium]MBU4397116.1 hypothetical protein [Patescibacteria group bacterium]
MTKRRGLPEGTQGVIVTIGEELSEPVPERVPAKPPVAPDKTKAAINHAQATIEHPGSRQPDKKQPVRLLPSKPVLTN